MLDVPTAAEVGLPTAIATNWLGISGPPKLPSYIIQTWDTVLKEMVRYSQIISQLRNIGAVAFYLDSQEIKKLIQKDIDDFKKFWR